MRSRLTWLIVTELIVGVVCAVAIAGEVLIYRCVRRVERELERAQLPADSLQSELDELRARLKSLEGKRARERAPRKAAKLPK